MKKIVLNILLLSFTTSLLKSQNVGINAFGVPPNTSAMLDILSSDKGLLVPRVALSDITVAAPVVTPAVSLIVYNTATAGVAPNNVLPGFYYWDGAKWVAFSGSGGREWALLGNAGTVAGTNFLGTTDAQHLDFRTNNTTKMRIMNSTYPTVGIGTTFPVTNLSGNSALLHIHDGGNSIGSQLILSTHSTADAQRTGVINFAATQAVNDRRAASIESYLTATSSTNVSGDLRFFTNNSNSFTEKMRILSTGNVGIATIAPTEKLDVFGNVKFSNALMPNNLPGTTGQVLVSQGAGVAPIWQAAASILKTYSAFATRTIINSAAWIDIIGLTKTVTTNGPAIFIIMTYGSIEVIGGSGGNAGCELKLQQNNVDVPNAFQTIDVVNPGSLSGTISLWSFQTVVSVAAAGTYIFKVQAHKYETTFRNFYAGGNTTAPAASQNQGAIIIQQFDQ